MKKTYINPQLITTHIVVTSLIAESVLLDRAGSAKLGTGEILVKEDRTRPSDYNVWNEDWSK